MLVLPAKAAHSRDARTLRFQDRNLNHGTSHVDRLKAGNRNEGLIRDRFDKTISKSAERGSLRGELVGAHMLLQLLTRAKHLIMNQRSACMFNELSILESSGTCFQVQAGAADGADAVTGNAPLLVESGAEAVRGILYFAECVQQLVKFGLVHKSVRLVVEARRCFGRELKLS